MNLLLLGFDHNKAHWLATQKVADYADSAVCKDLTKVDGWWAPVDSTGCIVSYMLTAALDEFEMPSGDFVHRYGWDGIVAVVAAGTRHDPPRELITTKYVQARQEVDCEIDRHSRRVDYGCI